MKIYIPKIERAEKEENYLSWIALFPILYTPIIYVSNFVISRYSGVISSGIKYLLYLVLGMQILFCIQRLLHAISTKRLLIFLWFILQYFFLILINSNSSEYFLKMLGTTTTCLGYFYIASLITDYETFYRVLKKASYVILVALLLYFVGNGVSGYRAYSGVSYGQALSYCFALTAIVSVVEVVIHTSILNIILLVASAAISMLLGTRGVLVCMIVCSVICLLFYREISGQDHYDRKMLLLIIMVVIGFIVAALLYDQIMVGLLALESRIGGNGRIIYKLLSNSFGESEGRNITYAKALSLINDRLFFGYGMSSERIALQHALGEFEPTYAHNIILEVLLQYGVIIGLLILGWFARKLYTVRVKCKNDQYRMKCYIVLISIGFVPLFMSSSYLQWSAFFILAGFMYGVIHNPVQEDGADSGGR